MVNNESGISTRAAILTILRNTPTPISGEKIGAELGLSRVAVWKSIQTLSESGYNISSSTLGYRLEGDLSDSILPWEFGSDEKRFRHWDVTDSTMNRARETALAGGKHGLVITSETQSDGRGTGNKKWESGNGGLFFTLITRPIMNEAYTHRQVLAAQCAITRSIQAITGIDAIPLWPNDIYILPQDKTSAGKVGGILCETLSQGNTVRFLNLGIGINTGRQPSIKGTGCIPTGRKELLQRFLTEFDKISVHSPDLIPLWNSQCPLTGQKITYIRQETNKIDTGIFRGVNEAGWAIIETLNESTDIHKTDSTGENCFPPGTITLLHKGDEK